MPSGGGAIGGGGGGGFGGGGFSAGGVSYAGWLSGSYHSGAQGNCNRKYSLLVLIFPVVFVVVLVALGLGLYYGLINRSTSTTPTVEVATDFYSPGDSRLLSFSSFFCESVSLNVDSTDTSASLTLINSPPVLSDRNHVNISSQSTLFAENYRFWQYHLYPGSNISILSECRTYLAQTHPDVYIVKGNSNANNWGNSPSSEHAELYVPAMKTCLKEIITTYYNVSEEDEYYVFLYNPGYTSVSYSVTLEIERFEYALPRVNTSVVSCSAPSGEQCTVGIPYGTGTQQVLVTTSIPENVDWGENVDVKIGCNRRHWALAIVILFPMITVAAVIVGLVICSALLCYKIRNKKRNGSYTAHAI